MDSTEKDNLNNFLEPVSKMALWNNAHVNPDFSRHVNDIVHGFVELDAFIWAVIDTSQFQRLRYLKQLGTTSYVWPCASHTRFEHSLGVAHLARKVMLHLRSAQPELGITDREIRCIQLAGVCHDLGHGAFSHVFDGRFIPLILETKPELQSDVILRNWSHEKASVMMFDYMLAQNNLEIDSEDCRFVKALIDGSSVDCPGEKPFLFDIVANKRNGIDVDKFDYILRDTRMFAQSADISIEKVINSMRVMNNQICYDVKDANQLSELCHKRYYLHKSHYNHKTATAIEYMICDIFLKAEKIFKISSRIHDPRRYQHLDDSILRQIAASESDDPDLVEARILIEKIHRRDLYKSVDYNYADADDMEKIERQITPETIAAAARLVPISDAPSPSIDDQEIDEAGDEEGIIDDLRPDHILVDIMLLHHGMKKEDPLKKIEWYSKSKKHLNTAHLAPHGALSHIRLTQYAELLVRVYVKDVKFFRFVQAGYRKAMQDMNIRLMIGTPPMSEAPSTPPKRETPEKRPEPSARFYTPNSFNDVPKLSPRRKNLLRDGATLSASGSINASPDLDVCRDPVPEEVNVSLFPSIQSGPLTTGTSSTSNLLRSPTITEKEINPSKRSRAVDPTTDVNRTSPKRKKT